MVKGLIIVGPGVIVSVPFWQISGVFRFFPLVPPWNNENKSCLNDIKFWEVSGNPKTSRFWKLQLFMSSGTQKGTKAIKPGPTMTKPFVLIVLLRLEGMKMYFIEQNHNISFGQVKWIFPSFSIPSAGDEGGSSRLRRRYYGHAQKYSRLS